MIERSLYWNYSIHMLIKSTEVKQMANNFFVKNSLYVTSVLASIVLVITIAFWNDMPMTQRLIGIYYFLIAAHEWEELKFPGGFVELVIGMTGMPVRDMRIPKLALFFLTLYMLVLPFCIPSAHWLVIGALVLGIIEPIAHIIAGRANPQSRIYSPGMITSFLFMIPLDIYTIWYLAAREPIAWYFWVAAALLLLIPLSSVQRIIVVHMMNMSYKDFILNARDSVLGKRKIQF